MSFFYFGVHLWFLFLICGNNIEFTALLGFLLQYAEILADISVSKIKTEK